jgi:hypothetical protein
MELRETNSSICPRCNRKFICQPYNIEQCQCSQIVLSLTTLEFIKTKGYQGCLCIDCLRELEEIHGDKFQINN